MLTNLAEFNYISLTQAFKAAGWDTLIDPQPNYGHFQQGEMMGYYSIHKGLDVIAIYLKWTDMQWLKCRYRLLEKKIEWRGRVGTEKRYITHKQDELPTGALLKSFVLQEEMEKLLNV
jgi:hypothetical protein